MKMNPATSDLLYGIPDGIDYAAESADLDLQDVPKERIEKVKDLLNSSDEYVVFQAARILTSWGEDAGFNKLAYLIDTDNIDGYITHRLHGYDDTLYHVLWAFRSYFSQKYNAKEWNEDMRTKIFPYISKIIDVSKIQPFDISSLFSFVERNHFDEYIPLLKDYLESIIGYPEIHGWKIHDALEFFLKIDPDFVNRLLKEKGKTLKDFNF